MNEPAVLTWRKGLSLDYLAPTGAMSGLIVYAHGGSFQNGTRNDRLARWLFSVMPGQGFAVASIQYRLGGRPLRGMQPDQIASIEEATARSAALYPRIPERLLGPLMYRAAQDFGAAVTFLREGADGPMLGCDLPVIAMGFSAGGLAALGHAHGLDGLPLPDMPPVLAMGISSVPPQPWRLRPDGPPTALMTARGDAVFPRRDVARAFEVAPWIEVLPLPYGAHNRPIRELTSGRRADGASWQDVVTARMRAAVGLA